MRRRTKKNRQQKNPCEGKLLLAAAIIKLVQSLIDLVRDLLE